MNRLKNQILLAAGFAVLAGVISGITAAPAIAQAIKAALVKNVDEPGRTPFEQNIEFTQSVCGLNCYNFQKISSCLFLDGAVVPAGKRFVIQHVSGLLPSANTDSQVVLKSTRDIFSFLDAKWSFFGPLFVPFSSVPVAAGFSSPAFTTYGPGERVHIQTCSPTFTDAIANIAVSGYLIDATN